MKRSMLIIICAIFLLLIPNGMAYANKPVEPDYYLQISQSDLHYGDYVSFTALYPKRATRSVTTQQTDNPVVQIDCRNPTTGAWMWRVVVVFVDETRHNDGSIYGISSATRLGGTGWSSGPAICSAMLYYIADRELHAVLIDSLSFNVNE